MAKQDPLAVRGECLGLIQALASRVAQKDNQISTGVQGYTTVLSTIQAIVLTGTQGAIGHVHCNWNMPVFSHEPELVFFLPGYVEGFVVASWRPQTEVHGSSMPDGWTGLDISQQEQRMK